MLWLKSKKKIYVQCIVIFSLIGAVVGQRSSPEYRLANKTKMHLTKKKKNKELNSNSLEYEDVLYFDLQPNPMACTLGSLVME